MISHEPNGADSPLNELHRQFLEADNDGASSNDVAQLLDDFLTERGYPTVLYRDRKARR